MASKFSCLYGISSSNVECYLNFLYLKNLFFLKNVAWKILANVANLRKSFALVICCSSDVMDSK